MADNRHVQCPRCGKTIDYLRYSATVTESGTYDPGFGYDEDNMETDDVYFSCPACLSALFSTHAEAEAFLAGHGLREVKKTA